MKLIKQLLVLFVLVNMVASCQKSTTDTPAEVKKPKVGTAWTYQLDNYGAGGTSFTSNTVVYKVSNEQTFGGETWLNVTDSTGATIYLFKQKATGLYNYANTAANLFCKDPATVNEAYNGFLNGAAESYTVKEIGITIGGGISVLGTAFPDFVCNRYEGVQAGLLKDNIWYNSDAWIIRKETYAVNMSGANNIRYRWRLIKMVF